MTYIVLMGGPGAGKGTQARHLSDQLGLPQVASGDLFRENLKRRTPLGALAKVYIDKGELVPDEVTVDMIKERLLQPDCEDGVLLDGFPRTINQATALDEFLAGIEKAITIVPYIHVSREVLLRRLAGRWTCKTCGHVYHIMFSPPKEAGFCDFDGSPLYQREDDTEETQRHRIEVYLKQTAPLLVYYMQRDLLKEIDGEQSIDEVFADLTAAVEAAKES